MKIKFLFILLNLFFSLISFSDVIVNGKVKYKNETIGNTYIMFIDALNTIYDTKSDIYGNYSINIPEGSYRINIKKDNFMIKQREIEIFDIFTNKNIDINLSFADSYIEGLIVDENEKPLSFMPVQIKNNDSHFTVMTDNNGYFSSYISSGITSILAIQNGYIETGDIRYINKNSSIKNLKIKLKGKKFFLKGIVSDGIKSLSNVQVSIHDEFFNKIASTVSDEKGYYQFDRVNIEKNAHLFVNIPNYEIFKSPEITLTNKTANNRYNIILTPKKR